HAGPGRRLRHSLPWSCGDRRDVQVLRSAYLLGFGVTRPNCARKQNSRQATDRVFDVGSTECPGPEPLNATIHSMRIEIMESLLDHVFITVRDLDRLPFTRRLSSRSTSCMPLI